MKKFTAVDLQSFLNAGRDARPLNSALGRPWQPRLATFLTDLPGGPTQFRGIPFDLQPWSAGGNAWMLLQEEPVTVPIDDSASHVVFAHFSDAEREPPALGQLSDLPSRRRLFVGQPGEPLAHYVLEYADGTVQRQAIRRRFEIGAADQGWNQVPFLALPHAEFILSQDADPDPLGWFAFEMGFVSDPSSAKVCYWIYALPCSFPGKRLEAVRLEPSGAGSVAIAGITLFRGKTHPLRYRRLETLEVSIPPEEMEKDGSTADVSVDLGVVTRKYRVPAFEPTAWLADPDRGWGNPSWESTSRRGWPRPSEPDTPRRIMLDLTASPDATLTVNSHCVSLARVFERPGGVAESDDGKVRVRLLTPEKVRVHVTVHDADSGEPTPVRIHLRAPDGRYLPPEGHRKEVNPNMGFDYGPDLQLGGTAYAYVDGHFQARLPVGDVFVEMVKGFEYEPVRQRVHIEPGQNALHLAIKRALNWRSKGWVSADPHVHFLSPQTAWLEAQAEGLNLVGLLATQWGDIFTNVGDVTDGVSGVSRDETLISVGTENRQNPLGHIILLGARGGVIHPLSVGTHGESFLGDAIGSSMADWADQCHRQGGVAIIAHFGNPHCEAIADIVLGKADAISVHTLATVQRGLEIVAVREWYRVLNTGYRIPLTGATDKMAATIPVGAIRTYTHIGDQELTFDNWARATCAGRTFTSTGPMLNLRVDGHRVGDEIRLPGSGGTLSIEAEAEAVLPFHLLQVVFNGRVIAEVTAEGGATAQTLRQEVTITESGWIAARCLSHFPDDPQIRLSAHTSPIYVVLDGKELLNVSDAEYLLTLLEGGVAWLETLATVASPERHKRILSVFRDAQAQLESRLETR